MSDATTSRSTERLTPRDIEGLAVALPIGSSAPGATGNGERIGDGPAHLNLPTEQKEQNIDIMKESSAVEATESAIDSDLAAGDMKESETWFEASTSMKSLRAVSSWMSRSSKGSEKSARSTPSSAPLIIPRPHPSIIARQQEWSYPSYPSYPSAVPEDGLLSNEREEFSELRALLPMFRNLRFERGIDNQFIISTERDDPGHRGSFIRQFSTMSRGAMNVFGKDDSSSTSSSSGEGGFNRDYVKLSRDIYSLIYFAPPFSRSFFFAIGTFIFQISILVLIMVDIIEPSSSNPLSIPSNVDIVVSVSQLFAIIISVATQDDLISSINFIHLGYNPDVITGPDVGGARWQWILSIGSCLLEGVMCLVITFVLIVQSNDVVGLFLDFLAVTFVSTLDDIAFALARDGYFSREIRDQTGQVMRVRVPKTKITSHRFRPILFLLVSGSLIAGWGIIKRGQRAGHYLSCRKIAVQFGDEFRATLGFFSSIYEVSGFDLQGRPIYTEQGKAIDNEDYAKAIFAYCETETAWTFSYPGKDKEDKEVNPCNWYAKSAETKSFDIMAISPAEWFAFGKESKGAVPFQHFSLLCLDCSVESERASCSSLGECVNNQCVCEESRYGLNCEFEEPCPFIEIDTSTIAFPGPEVWSDKYEILYHEDEKTKVNVYERPVYRSTKYDKGFRHVIMFTGRRWILSSTEMVMNTQTEPVDTYQLSDFLENSFHAHWTEYRSEFVSSPTDVITPTDAATPVGLHWYRSKTYSKGADTNFRVETQLLCSVCNSKNQCSNEGTCEDGTCQCPYGTFGTLCQIKSFVLCQSIVVQFGDELISSMGTFSGVYDMSNRTISGRVVYVAQQHKHAMFAYCEEENAWVFVTLPPGDSHHHVNPCTEWKAMSRITETYDITTLETGWVVRRNQRADDGIPFERFQLFCVDCGRNKKKRQCSGSGHCEGNYCVCDEGSYGVTCQHYEPCQNVELDSSRQMKQPANYDVLRGEDNKQVEVYQRPVYISMAANQTFLIILFIGSRWVITRSENYPSLNYRPTTNELAKYFKNSFHGNYSKYEIEFVSEPVFINSILDTPSPVDLNWYYPKAIDNMRPDLQSSLTRVPRCASCNSLDYPCFNKGLCRNGKCVCRSGTFGSVCQIDSVCTSLSVEFGKKLKSPLPRRKGIYHLKGGPNNTFGERPVYMRKNGKGMFAYCSTMQAWTFTYWVNGVNPDTVEPCGNWTAKSGASYLFDIEQVEKWFLKKNATHSDALLPSSFAYACNDERRKAAGDN